jgi:hypothetical protein
LDRRGHRRHAALTTKGRVEPSQTPVDDARSPHREQLLPTMIDDGDAANTQRSQGRHNISVEAPKGTVHHGNVDLCRSRHRSQLNDVATSAHDGRTDRRGADRLHHR